MPAQRLPPQPSLTTIPLELQLSFAWHLDPMSRHLLCSVNSNFRNLLPQLAHRQLLVAENSTYARNHHIQTCRVCLRLRPNDCFAADRLTKFDSLLCGDRFCIDCGSRPLTKIPEEDYGRSPFCARWNIDGKRYGRCARCKGCKPGQWKPGYWLQEVCEEREPLDEMERVAADEGERREEVEFYKMKGYWPARC